MYPCSLCQVGGLGSVAPSGPSALPSLDENDAIGTKRELGCGSRSAQDPDSHHRGCGDGLQHVQDSAIARGSSLRPLKIDQDTVEIHPGVIVALEGADAPDPDPGALPNTLTRENSHPGYVVGEEVQGGHAGRTHMSHKKSFNVNGSSIFIANRHSSAY